MNKSLYWVVSLLVALQHDPGCLPDSPHAKPLPLKNPLRLLKPPLRKHRLRPKPPLLKQRIPAFRWNSAKVAPQFFSDEDYNKSDRTDEAQPLNPNDPIYLQYLRGEPDRHHQVPPVRSIC